MSPRRSLIFDTTVRFVFDAAVVLSLYMLFAGHNQPGGGFIGGLVAAGAVSLRYIAGGVDEVRSLLRFRPSAFLAVGMALAAGTALVPALLSDAPLDHRAFELTIPAVGKVKATTAAIFDSGVYLIVVGLLLMVFEGLGDDAADDGMGEQAR